MSAFGIQPQRELSLIHFSKINNYILYHNIPFVSFWFNPFIGFRKCLSFSVIKSYSWDKIYEKSNDNLWMSSNFSSKGKYTFFPYDILWLFFHQNVFSSFQTEIVICQMGCDDQVSWCLLIFGRIPELYTKHKQDLIDHLKRKVWWANVKTFIPDCELCIRTHTYDVG